MKPLSGITQTDEQKRDSDEFLKAQFMTPQPQPTNEQEMRELTHLARCIAIGAHAGQFRRDGKTPYVTHPEAVAEMVPERLKPVALLHDVLEDTEFSEASLRVLFPKWIVDTVALLTRKQGVHYADYMDRLILNPDAVEVKLADMNHNFSCNPSVNSIQKINYWRPRLEAAKSLFERSKSR